MDYKVLPFNAFLSQDEDASAAASQLQALIAQEAAHGYEFVCLDSIETSVAPTSGCLGIGAKPGYSTSVAVVIFKKS